MSNNGSMRICEYPTAGGGAVYTIESNTGCYWNEHRRDWQVDVYTYDSRELAENAMGMIAGILARERAVVGVKCEGGAD